VILLLIFTRESTEEIVFEITVLMLLLLKLLLSVIIFTHCKIVKTPYLIEFCWVGHIAHLHFLLTLWFKTNFEIDPIAEIVMGGFLIRIAFLSECGNELPVDF
jgi:hypothetical protein